jgi:hypothetical protein
MSKENKECRFLSAHDEIRKLTEIYSWRASQDATVAIRTKNPKDIHTAEISVAKADLADYLFEQIKTILSNHWPRDDKGTAL